MTDLAALKSRLYDRTPLLGGGRRRKAAEALAALDDLTCALPLAETLVGLEDPAVHAVAIARLAQIEDPAAIDAVCGLWLRARHPRLATLIAQLRWVAREPWEVRVAGLLATGGAEAMRDAVPELVPALVGATGDHDPAIADAARAALAGLRRQDAREALCDMVLDLDDAQAARSVREGGHLPDDPRRRALVLLLTEQGEAYEAADPDGRLLVEALRIASPERRRRMAERAKQAKLGPWARAVLARPIVDMQPSEWEALLLVLAEQRDFAAIWRLVPAAPVLISVGYMRYLRMVGWTPPADSPEHGLFQKLAGLLQRCTGDPNRLARQVREATLFDGKPGQATCLAVSSDWRFLAVGGDDNHVRVISMPDGAPVATLGELPGWTRQLSFGAGGRFLAIATMKHQTRIYRLPEGAPAGALDTRDVAVVALRGDGKLLAAASGARVDLWDVESGVISRSVAAHGRLVKGLTIGARGDALASWGADGAVRVWSLPECRLIAEIVLGVAGIATVALSADDARLAVAGSDHMVRVYALPDATLLTELPGEGHAVRSLAFRPDGEVLAVGGHDHRVRLFTVPNGEPLGAAEGYAGAGALAWNSLGQLLAAAADGKRIVRVWAPAAPPMTDATIRSARPEEIAWAQRLHRDPDLGREQRAWLTYWGTLVLAARGQLPPATPATTEAGPASAPHPWEPPEEPGAAQPEGAGAG